MTAPYAPPALCPRRAAVVFLLLLALVGCSGQATSTPTPPPTATTTAGTPTPSLVVSPSTSPDPSGAIPSGMPSPAGHAAGRACDYRPGNTVVTMPAGVDEPSPSEPGDLPANSPVPVATTARQLAILDSLAEIVPERYFDPALNGVDWTALVDEYRALVEAGYTDEDFEIVLYQLVAELGDDHSYVQSEASIRESEEQLAGQNDYVGIGVYAAPLPDDDRATILTVFPDSPAERAGLRAHDSILTVNGEPILDDEGGINPNLRGLPGTVAQLTVERAGEGERELSITRAPISGALPIISCLVPDTGIAYLMVPCLCDLTIPQQIRDALAQMAQVTPLTGVVLDNRVNGGGDERALRAILELFVDGYLGDFESTDPPRRFEIDGEDVAGSQALPVAVLVGSGTASYGEVMSGALQATDDATVVGATTGGNVETLYGHDLAHGWRLWLAEEAFASADATYGPWEDTGIRVDIEVPTRWDLYTEATDPALAAAVSALLDARDR